MKKFLLALLMFPSAAFAAPEVLENFLNSRQAYEAKFLQRTVDDSGEVTSISSGTMALQRDVSAGIGKFRWQYQEPWEQLIIADGTKLWQYDVDLEQVTVRPMRESLAGTPAELLVGGMLLQDWDISEDDVWITLKPKDNDLPFQSIALRFEDEDLAGMKLLDQFDQTTHLVFDAVNQQPEFAVDAFVFEPTADMEVIGGEEG